MNDSKLALLSAQNISKSYQIGKEKIHIFDNFSLDIRPREHVSIMGSSGSGKSTLLTLLAGLDFPDSGKILFDKKDITQFSENELASLRRADFGFVFQSFHLMPSLSVIENVRFPLELSGMDPKTIELQALEMLERIGLSHRAQSFPYQLSGGEKQRTAIARALIHQPKILFADEPTGNLDEENSDQVLKLLIGLQKEFGTTLIVVTHEVDIARLADRTLFLEHGKLKNLQL